MKAALIILSVLLLISIVVIGMLSKEKNQQKEIKEAYLKKLKELGYDIEDKSLIPPK